MQIIQLSIIHNTHAIGHSYLEPRFYYLEQSKEHIYTSLTYGYCYLDTFCDITNLHIHQNQWWNRQPGSKNTYPWVKTCSKLIQSIATILSLCKNGLFTTLSNLIWTQNRPLEMVCRIEVPPSGCAGPYLRLSLTLTVNKTISLS